MQVRNTQSTLSERPREFVEWKLIGAWEGVSPEVAVRAWSELPERTRQHYQELLRSLRAGCPLDYLLPYTEIKGHRFQIREGVLIPRPETEELIDIVQSATSKPSVLVDVGCGSGVIGVCLSKIFAQVIMLDISPIALESARRNIALNAVQNARVYLSNLLNNLPSIQTNWWLVANLPYVPLGDKVLEKEHRTEFEPDLAIYSGASGLDLFAKLIEQITTLPRKPTRLFFELDPRNIRQAHALCVQRLKVSGSVVRDLDNQERFLVV